MPVAHKTDEFSYEFSVPGVECASCSAVIENILLNNGKPLDNKVKFEVLSVNVDVFEKIATVKIKKDELVSEDQVQKIIIDQLKDVGQDVVPAYVHWLKGGMGIFFGLALMILCACGIPIPMLAMYLIGGFSVLLSGIIGYKTFINTFKQLKETPKTWSMDRTLTLFSFLTIGVSIAHLFVSWLPMLFDAPLLILGFRNIGKGIEDKIKRNVFLRKSFRSSINPNVTVLTSDEDHPELTTTRHVKDVVVGSVIKIYGQQIIPLDGICLSPEALVNTSSKDGILFPTKMASGGALYAGMKLEMPETEFILVKVTRDEEHSELARKDKLLRASTEPTDIALTIKKFVNYIPFVGIGLAIVAGVAIGLFINPILAIHSAFTVLAAVCPCTIGTVGPLAEKVGMEKAAKAGVSFKEGKNLQLAAEIDTVVIDIHGTLTTGEYQIKGTRVVSKEISEKSFLEICHQLESAYVEQTKYKHAIANAILNYTSGKIPDRGEKLPKIKVDVSHHSGLRATIDGHDVVLGDSDMMKANDIYMDEEHQQLLADNPKNTITFLARDKKIVGYLKTHDPLRDDAKYLVDTLKKMGKQVYLCTGAPQREANEYAKQLGFNDRSIKKFVKAACTYDSKKEFIERLIKVEHRKVSMVGEGSNDPAAIKASHFGIAVVSNSTDEKSEQEAAVEINKDQLSLKPVITAFVVANQTLRYIKQNLAISIIFNVSVVIGSIAVGIFCPPLIPAMMGIAAAMMVLQMCLLRATAYHFKNHQPLKHLQDKTFPPEKWKSSSKDVLSKCPRDITEKTLAPSIVSKASFALSRTPSRRIERTASAPALMLRR